MRAFTKFRVSKIILLLVFGVLLTYPAFSQTGCGYSNFQFQRVTANINSFMGGFLWRKPSDYDSNPTKYYPTIIYFHGVGTLGGGSASDLCLLFNDNALPLKIQNGEAIMTVTSGGFTYEFMVFCPQYTHYTYPSSYPSAGEVSSAVNYFTSNYRVDPNRIYLTGMSTGSSMVMEYATASIANAQKVAGIVPVSLCAMNITNTGYISSTNLPVWINHCTNDSRCPQSIPQGWVSAINNNNPPPNPLAKLTLVAAGPYFCSPPDSHNSWPLVYQSSYVVDGTNLYQWMIQYYRNNIVPVMLSSYTARLVNGKVYLRWITEREAEVASFTIEKAGTDQRFTELVSIKITGNSSREKIYEYIDEKPLANLNYYRLLQTDADGHKHYFETRRILNRNNNKVLFISPNPFSGDLSAFINIGKAQRVTFSISDMSGRILKTTAEFYKEGNSEINIITTHLPKGIYLLKMQCEDFTETQKVIKQ